MKVDYYATVFDKYKDNLKETWKIINYILGKPKLQECSSLLINNQLRTGSLAIANHFNNYFASVASKLTENLPPSP